MHAFLRRLLNTALRAATIKDLADKIYEVLINEDLREKFRKLGLEYSNKFTWEKTIKMTIKVYRQLI